jgi:hypothetical protein
LQACDFCVDSGYDFIDQHPGILPRPLFEESPYQDEVNA